MDFNAESLKKVYLDWIKNGSNFFDIKGDWVEIETPFTNFSGDTISLFAKKLDDKKFHITDYGNILNELDMHGISTKRAKRNQLLEKILYNQHCYIDENNGISIDFFDIKNFPKYKHQLIQAVININDLFLTSDSNVTELFYYDVCEFLDKKEISYSRRQYSLEGKNNLSNTFDINIGGIKRRALPTLHTRILNNLTENSMKSIIFAKYDLSLQSDEKLALIVNDANRSPNDKQINALQTNDIEIILWNRSDQYFSKYGVSA